MKKILYTALLAILFGSCSSPRLIPEQELQRIITQTLISDAIITIDATHYGQSMNRSSIDSIDVYAPLITQNGYTLDDFRYSINTYAMRKSNPLDNIFENVSKEIDKLDATAKYRYKRLMKFDTIAMDYYADTVYRQEKLITGSLNKVKFNILPTQIGRYTITFDYLALRDTRVPTKQIQIEAASKPTQEKGAEFSNRYRTRFSNTYWLTKNQDTSIYRQKFVQEFNLTIKYDSLKVWFVETSIPKDVILRDSSWIANVKVIYHPTASQARTDYYYLITGFHKSIKEDYEQRYTDLYDSIVVPYRLPRHHPKRWLGGVRQPGDTLTYGDGSTKPRLPAPYLLP